MRRKGKGDVSAAQATGVGDRAPTVEILAGRRSGEHRRLRFQGMEIPGGRGKEISETTRGTSRTVEASRRKGERSRGRMGGSLGTRTDTSARTVRIDRKSKTDTCPPSDVDQASNPLVKTRRKIPCNATGAYQ